MCCLMCTHSTECFPVYCFITVLCDARNDVLPCWTGPTVSRSASELEVQKYSMKKIFWLLILSCWKTNCEWDNMKNRPPTAKVVCFENWTAETEFSVFEFWGYFRFGLVFRKPICDIFITNPIMLKVLKINGHFFGTMQVSLTTEHYV